MAESKTRRIVLLGKTGAGKSSLANTICGEKLFKVLPGFTSVTSVCETKTKSVNVRNITLIDTPGFFDTDSDEEKLKPEIVRCITECSPGPHAFLIVLKLERFTEQEEAVIYRMTKYFSEDVFKYSTVVFTHGDELPEGEKIEDLVKQNKALSDFIEKCGGRCHVIDNKHWNNDPEDKYRSNEYQVEEILKSIEKTVEANSGDCYTNEMLQEIERIIQQEEKHIAETSENMSKEEIRKEAKSRVNKILIKATGITVGALLGALFGVLMPAVLLSAGLAGGVKSVIKAVGAVGVTRGTAGAAAVAGGGAVVAGGGAVVAAGVEAGAAGGAIGTGLTAGAAGAAGVEAGAAGGAIGTGLTAGAAGAEAVVAAGVEAGAAGGAIGAGLIAGGVTVGLLAAVGAGFGGYEGHQAAQTAETKQEAAEKAAKAVWSEGLKAVKGAYNLASQLNKELEYTLLEEKDSEC